MANVKISALPADISVTGTEEIPVNDAGTTRKATATQVAALAKGLPLALTGATAATRYVGGTTSGAPTTGTFAVGDFVIAQNGAVWVCTTAGTPGTWTQIGGGGSSTGTVELLTSVAYNPASEINFTTTSTAFVDCDATNLVATFAAPASGQVLIRLTGIAQINTTTVLYYWGLRSGTSDVAGSSMFVVYGGGVYRYTSAACRITGLASGTSYSFKWAHRVSASATGQLRVGATNGAAVMEVWAA